MTYQFIANKKYCYLKITVLNLYDGAIGGTKTNPSLFYTTQKEESLAQPHNIINDCICNIS